MYMMAQEQMRPQPFVEVGVDRGELERIIQYAFETAFGQEEVIDVYVSRFPYEYGALVFLKNEPPPEAETIALQQEEQFRALGIRLGILIRKAKGTNNAKWKKPLRHASMAHNLGVETPS